MAYINEKLKQGIKFIENNTLLTATIINAVVALIIILTSSVQYEVSDDFVMETIVSGLYNNEKTIFLPYSHLGLGVLLKGLYTMYSGINWYGICMLFFGYLGFTTLTYCLFKRQNFQHGLFLQAIIYLFYLEDIYVSVQFTKLSVFLIMIGSFMFLHGLFREEKKIALYWGGFLVVVGSWYRYNGLFIAGLYVVCMVLLTLWNNKKMEPAKILKSLLYGVILIVTILSSLKLDTLIKNNDEGMEKFISFNEVRASLSDYSSLGYQNNKHWLDQEGFTANDYYCAVDWGFSDSDFYNQERLEVLNTGAKETRNQKEVDLNWVKEKAYSREYKKYLVLYGSIILILLILVYKPSLLFMVCPLAAITFGLFAYFYSVNRIVFRVEYTILMALFLSILYVYTEYRHKNRGKIFMSILLLAMILFKVNYVNYYTKELESFPTYYEKAMGTYYDSWDNEPMRYYIDYNEEIYEDITYLVRNNPDNYYFLDFGSTIQTLYLDKPFFQCLEEDIYQNMSYHTGVTTNYPTVLKQLESSGISNPATSLLEEQVFYISNIEWRDNNLLAYLREHYNPEINLHKVNELNGLNIYKFE